MLSSAEFWVAVSFFLFVALLLYYRIPERIIRSLDSRAEEIQRELEEARRLREEAQAILAEYQRKQRDAVKDSEEIVALAEREAHAYAEETRQTFDEMLQRRLKLADEKIARAEAQAIEEVRARSVDAAIRAAEILIAQRMDDEKAEQFLKQSLAEIEKLRPS